jgi:hypothetical protein
VRTANSALWANRKGWEERMVRMGTAAAGAFGIAAALTLFATGSAVADDGKLNGDGGYVYKGAPRTFLWNPQPN